MAAFLNCRRQASNALHDDGWAKPAGQIQLLVIAMAALALMLFDEGRRIVPAALLAAACTIKIFPGILLLHLAFRRRWSAVLATSGFVVGYAALGWIVLGRGRSRHSSRITYRALPPARHFLSLKIIPRWSLPTSRFTALLSSWD